ncbi:MAG TPA: flavin reductase family protein [Dehalococcoidia bacterium]
MRRSLSELDARRLLVPGPVCLVTTTWKGSDNVAPVAWSMPLSVSPPLVGIAVHPARHTHDMIRFSEEFAINIPGPRLLNHVQYFGSVSGRDLDKLDLSKLPTFRARKVDAPLLEHCVAYIECGLEDAYAIGDHTLFVGRVVAVAAEKEAFDEAWLLEDPDLRPLHYLGGAWYAALERRLEAQPPLTEEGALDVATLEEMTREQDERAAEERGERERRGEEPD